MGKGFFSIDNLKGLGEDKFNQLQDLAIDSGQAFLSGQITNVVFKSTQNQTTQNLIGAAATGFGAYATGKQMFENREEIITTLSQEIISQVVTIITKEVTAAGSEYLLRHTKQLASFPKNVTSYALSYFNANKGEANKEAINAIIKKAEDRSKELSETEKKNKQSEFVNKMKESSANVISKINEYSKVATTYVGMVTSYLENGPEWVSEQVDKQIASVVDNVKKNIDDQWNNKDLPAYQEKIESLGTDLGEEMIKQYLNALEKTQKLAMEKIEKTKSKALLKILQAKGIAASKIASLTGVYIPI